MIPRSICSAAVLAILFAVGARAQDRQYIDLTRVAPGTWRATYRFDSPVQALRFSRPAGFFREDVWRILTPGYGWERQSGTQLLALAANAQPVQTVTVEFPEHTAHLPKEYEFFQPFSDGGVAIYTGHLYVTSERASGETSESVIHTLRLTSPPGFQTVVRGRVEREPFEWTDHAGDGTYVYFGQRTPTDTPHLVAIVDAGMPPWLREQMEHTLPQLFAMYAERLDATLPWKPVVLYGFEDSNVSGYSSGGGTLTGLIQLTVSGSSWRDETADAREHAFHLLAHEAAHLWNGQLVKAPGGSASWMHEGAADAMANDLLFELGVIDSVTHRQRREEAINRCALGLEGAPLNQAHVRGAFQVLYDCGHVLALWTAAAVRQADSESDLFTFWRALLRAAEARSKSYDEDVYFEVLAALGASDDVVLSMRAFLSAQDPMPIGARGLTNSGVPIAEGAGEPPDYFQRELGRRALIHLMLHRCGRVSFYTESYGFRTEAVSDCAEFENELPVADIAGASVMRQGATVYRRAREQCSTGGAISLSDSQGGVLAVVQCSESLPSPPSWWVLGAR